MADLFVKGAWNESWQYPSLKEPNVEEAFFSLTPFYFSFESNFDVSGVLEFSRFHYFLSPLAAAAYLLLVYLGQRWMSNRKAFDLRIPLIYWNLFLAVFSLWGACRMVPQMSYFVWKFGFLNSMCSPFAWQCLHGAGALWGMLFVYSKFFELVDTAFIVLRKSRLILLHWYHHATVLLYSWHCLVMQQPPCLYFCTMNYIVHAVMYYYYYLAAKGTPPKWGVVVTSLQIVQMVFGMALTVLGYWLSVSMDSMTSSDFEQGVRPISFGKCDIDRTTMRLGMLMYISYFFLFAAFFVKRYCSRRRRKEEKKEMKENEEGVSTPRKRKTA